MDSKSFLKNKSILSRDNAAVKMTWVKIPTSFFFFQRLGKRGLDYNRYFATIS